MFKYTFTIKTTLLELLRNQKTRLNARFQQNYKDLVFARVEFLRIFGAPNESLTLIIIYYMFKYTFTIKTTLLELLRNQKTRLNA